MGASNKGGVGKISSFPSLSVNISKTVADTAIVTILMTNMKSHMFAVRSFLSEFRLILRVWEAATAKRMKTDL